jgi:Rrf2 family transcriptional regulator, iron-sulfur cluster assembly transcription factor
MLNLSANGDYGLLLLRELALASKGKYLSLADLAASRRLPRKYLEQVAHALVEAGVLVSREGRGGGYKLSRDAKDIKLTDVLTALEGALEPVACTHCSSCCERSSACERKTGWWELHRQLFNTLKTKSLADVVRTAAKS